MAKEYTLEQLRAFGYAPGNYISNCGDCKKMMQDVDKYAHRCKPCAIALFENTLKEEQKYTVKETFDIRRDTEGNFYFRLMRAKTNERGPFSSITSMMPQLREAIEDEFGK